jgi:hypothetical protein
MMILLTFEKDTTFFEITLKELHISFWDMNTHLMQIRCIYTPNKHQWRNYYGFRLGTPNPNDPYGSPRIRGKL